MIIYFKSTYVTEILRFFACFPSNENIYIRLYIIFRYTTNLNEKAIKGFSPENVQGIRNVDRECKLLILIE